MADLVNLFFDASLRGIIPENSELWRKLQQMRAKHKKLIELGSQLKYTESMTRRLLEAFGILGDNNGFQALLVVLTHFLRERKEKCETELGTLKTDLLACLDNELSSNNSNIHPHGQDRDVLMLLRSCVENQ